MSPIDAASNGVKGTAERQLLVPRSAEQSRRSVNGAQRIVVDPQSSANIASYVG
jgi:hypothetical protein